MKIVPYLRITWIIWIIYKFFPAIDFRNRYRLDVLVQSIKAMVAITFLIYLALTAIGNRRIEGKTIYGCPVAGTLRTIF